jgi:hypothetical protein
MNEFEIDYKMGNSPKNTLEVIFCPWFNSCSLNSNEKIKQAQFQLGVWEIGGELKKTVPKKYSPFHPDLDLNEAAFACAIYHPKYGDGSRDERGRLQVTYSKRTRPGRRSDGRRSISQDWLDSHGPFRGGSFILPDGRKTSSAKEFIVEGGVPNMEKRGLLTRNDFFANAESSTMKQYGFIRPIKSEKGYVTLKDGIRYTFGSQFGRGDYEVHIISDTVGALVQVDKKGNKKLTHTFHLVKPDNPNLKPVTDGKGKVIYLAANKREVDYQMKEYGNDDDSLFVTKLADESDEEFRERSLAFDFSSFLNIKDEFVKQTKVSLETLSPREKAAIISWYQRIGEDKNAESKKEKIYNFAKTYKQDGLRIFLAVESDYKVGDVLLDLQTFFSPAQMESIVKVLSEIIKKTEKESESLAEKMGIGDDNGRGQQIVFDGAMKRVRDVLLSLSENIDDGEFEDSSSLVDDVRKQLESETDAEKVALGLFTKIAGVLSEKEDGNTDLRRYIDEQNVVVDTAAKSGEAGLYLRALAARGELKPVPEIHWRVDRTLEDYKRRFGFDVQEFLKVISEKSRKKLLLEFGPGSGASKSERAGAGLVEMYMDVAMADALYYPLGKFIENIIDWEKLEKDIKQSLSQEDRSLLADALYKVAVIADGETQKDKFSYAKDRVEAITQNPSVIYEVLKTISKNFGQTSSIPDTISSRDEQGNVLYPYKINLEAKDKKKTLKVSDKKKSEARSIPFVTAKAALSDNIEKYFKEDAVRGDVYNYIPAYPTGLMTGDFSDVKALKDNQIDVAIGVRSTVYKRDDDYVEFMFTMADKLADKGVLIDDSIRDNDGFYYRLGELVSVAETLREQRREGVVDYDVNVSVILGPGFPGEDYRQDEVPLAVVMAKNTSVDATIRTLLKDPAYRFVSLQEYVQDRKNLRTLDAGGQSLKTFEDVVGMLGLSSLEDR